MTPTQARQAAQGLILFLQEQIFYGLPVDLGFLKVKPRHRGPATIRFNLAGKNVKNKPVHIVGEHVKFHVKISEHWQKRTRPKWSRY